MRGGRVRWKGDSIPTRKHLLIAEVPAGGPGTSVPQYVHSVQCLTGAAVCGYFIDIRTTLRFTGINAVQPRLEAGRLASMTSSKGPFLRNFRQCSCTNRSRNPSCIVSHSSGGVLTPRGPFNRSLSNRPQVSAMPPRFCCKYLKRRTNIPHVQREITQLHLYLALFGKDLPVLA